ncbi:sulfotransferase family protein [Nocardioides sp. zg-1228]|uniref:sulfotransferase family protein n=1 Tax=Nocardioides sp. zg-1228 TaxID=2763008 RepID=UPI001642FE2B|nr:sulfotransferase family protein [Nocardioides sp. zg-1228]MBC2931991.1 sulfotransferase family protein [Nocardioides sp. zg-1228]QSF57546.1 sulfotransferase family protein [Nocardioides sp. zg-1228]
MTEPTRRRVVFVVGSGRSGTSTMAGTLRTLGLHVPQPEVVADATNPKGFGEPRWVVDLHTELLARSNVQVSDARPRAWLDTGTTSGDHATRARVAAWLEEQLAVGDELVIKDPRAAWFLGLWRAAADRCGATSSYVTMLRPVTEVVGSKQTYYGSMGTGRGGAGADQGAITRTAAWVNMMLHTERATRGRQRAFVHYADLLDDWTQPVFALGEAFDLAGVKTAMAVDIAEVHRFIDPSLRRVTMTWDDIPVPDRLRELADETWQALDAIASDDTPAHQEWCDQLRIAYAEQYAEAEAFAHSTVVAQRRAAAAEARREAGGQPARSAVDRVPHAVRAMVPPAARERLRKAIGRERPQGPGTR